MSEIHEILHVPVMRRSSRLYLSHNRLFLNFYIIHNRTFHFDLPYFIYRLIYFSYFEFVLDQTDSLPKLLRLS